MAALNFELYAAATTGLHASYLHGLDQAEPLHLVVAQVDTADTGQQTIVIPEMVGAMREWVGDRHFVNLQSHVHTVKILDFERSVEVDRNHIEDDIIGQYAPSMVLMGMDVALWPDQIVFDKLLTGFTAECWDGTTFFATDHPMKVDTQSNRITNALDAAGFAAALANLRGRKKWDGSPLRMMRRRGKLKLLVPPALENAGRAIVMEQFTTGGRSNQYYEAAELVVVEEWADETQKWVLTYDMEGAKPMRWFIRKAPEWVVQDRPEDENNFNRKKIRMGVDARGAAAFNLWQLAVGSEGTG
jgi:phage major head subunit gpT-like protein